MELARYVACICEGGAETAIMDLLLDHDLLIVKREDLLEEQVLSCRSGREFETRYLRHHRTKKEQRKPEKGGIIRL